jgi:hypothetical protein
MGQYYKVYLTEEERDDFEEWMAKERRRRNRSVRELATNRLLKEVILEKLAKEGIGDYS